MDNKTLLPLVVFKNSKESFLSALDQEGISHTPSPMAPSQFQASGFLELIKVLGKAPWETIDRIVVAWLDARNSRKVIINTRESEIIHLEGYSPSDVKEIISTARNIMVIDTKPESLQVLQEKSYHQSDSAN